MNQETAKWIMIVGTAVFIIGLIWYFFHDKLDWIGHLPGDIRIERANFRFYFPLATCVLFSLCIIILVYIARKL